MAVYGSLSAALDLSLDTSALTLEGDVGAFGDPTPAPRRLGPPNWLRKPCLPRCPPPSISELPTFQDGESMRTYVTCSPLGLAGPDNERYASSLSYLSTPLERARAIYSMNLLAGSCAHALAYDPLWLSCSDEALKSQLFVWANYLAALVIQWRHGMSEHILPDAARWKFDEPHRLGVHDRFYTLLRPGRREKTRAHCRRGPKYTSGSFRNSTHPS